MISFFARNFKVFWTYFWINYEKLLIASAIHVLGIFKIFVIKMMWCIGALTSILIWKISAIARNMQHNDTKNRNVDRD